jgi:hypothetical protein
VNRRLTLAGLLALVVLALSAAVAFAAPPLSGAIFTTDQGCNGVNINIFGDKDAVYLDGGPTHPGAAGLPEGDYYAQVTEPDGTLLGTSVSSGNDTPIHVNPNGDFAECYQLSTILIKTSDSTPGYDDTSNPGGEYKVWVSTVSTFDENSAKTDNFKVKEGGGEPQNQATLHVSKYYDANANGLYDSGEALLTGWKFHIHDEIDWIRFTPADLILDPDKYWVSEFKPVQSNWIATDTGTGAVDNQTGTPTKEYSLAGGADETARFGNVCVGAGGGLTLGFWSNNNGLATMQKMPAYTDSASVAYPAGLNAQLAFLRDHNLVQNDKKANGYAFNPTASKELQTWLLKADATNMAYMLSAQLAAMELNVRSGKVSGAALIYAPGTASANALGFATVNSVMAEANADLGANPTTVKAGALRSHQEALKIALDKGNNNLNFVQSSACPYTFQ